MVTVVSWRPFRRTQGLRKSQEMASKVKVKAGAPLENTETVSAALFLF